MTKIPEGKTIEETISYLENYRKTNISSIENGSVSCIICNRSPSTMGNEPMYLIPVYLCINTGDYISEEHIREFTKHYQAYDRKEHHFMCGKHFKQLLKIDQSSISIDSDFMNLFTHKDIFLFRIGSKDHYTTKIITIDV